MHTLTRYLKFLLYKAIKIAFRFNAAKLSKAQSFLNDSRRFNACYFYALDMPPANPCIPSPCGPNSECRVINNQAVCSCVRGYLGSPPTCRPECIVSTDCPQNEACSNQKCTNPCPGSCGLNALCHVVNHNPICVCPPLQTGDPFVRCYQEARKYA